jgi:hypothetical protein
MISERGAVCGMRTGRGNRDTRKSGPVLLCPPQISHYLTSDRTKFREEISQCLYSISETPLTYKMGFMLFLPSSLTQNTVASRTLYLQSNFMRIYICLSYSEFSRWRLRGTNLCVMSRPHWTRRACKYTDRVCISRASNCMLDWVTTNRTIFWDVMRHSSI